MCTVNKSLDIIIQDLNSHLHLFFYKQPVFKQLALEWKIAKQLSGFKPLSLSNNKSYRYRKGDFFLAINVNSD